MMTSPITPNTQSPPALSPTASPASTSSNSLANESTFLKLLVTQLKNQDPANPQDSTQFVAQLAQFSGLEQTIQIRQDLDAIKQDVQPPAATGTTTVGAQA